MSIKKYILVIDEGTTGTKAYIFDRKLNVVSQSYRELTLYSSADGKAEMDGEEIYNKSIDACREAIAKAGIDASELACIGIGNQRATALGWQRDSGKPFCNAISWQDTRISHMKERVTKDGMLGYIRENHGRYQPTHGIFLIKWMAENVPGFLQKAVEGELLFGTIDSWLVYRLTGGKSHHSSIDNASYSGMIKTSNLQLSTKLFKYLGLPLYALPTPMENSAFYGVTNKNIFGVEIPITGIVSDQHAAIYAQRVIHKGDCKCTNGTGSFININIGNQYTCASESHSVALAWKIHGEPTYVAESTLVTSGTFLRWIKNNLGVVKDYREIDDMAKYVNDSGGVVVLPTLFGMIYPKIDSSLRGAIMGISESVQKEHIMRASLEGIAFLIRHVTQTMINDLGIKLNTVRIDGGISKSNVFCEILSNIMNIGIRRPQHVDLTALGTAEIAGLQMGMWNEDEFNNLLNIMTFSPQETEAKNYDKRFQLWLTALERAMNWPS